MIIGIDASMLVYQGSGVASYTYNLIKHLLLYDKKNEYRIFYSSFRKPKETIKKLEEFKKLGGKVYVFPFPPRVLKFLWNKHHFLPVEWLIGKVDFFHSSDFLRPPLLKGTKGITTIHDLTWKIYPEYHTKEIVEAHERKLEKTIKYKDIIIVDSKNTQKDLYKYYPIIKKNNKVYVIYPGVDSRFRPIKDKNKIEKALKKYLTFDFQLATFNFLLYVGAIEPRKNLDTAIEVFAKFVNSEAMIIKPPRLKRNGVTGKPRRLERHGNWKFLIVGRAGWKNEKIFRLVKELKLEDKVVFVGYVEDEDLPYFYNAARVLVYLSKYEGFGLPPLEALTCGTPVIAGENSSLKEILPKEYLVDLKNNNQILEKLISLLSTKKPVKIKTSFRWKEHIKQFLQIVQDENQPI